MKSAPVGRPKNPSTSERHTLVLDPETDALLAEMRRRFHEKWGAVPTLSVLIGRALRFASEEVIDTPPEHERVRVAQAHLRRLKAEVDASMKAANSNLLPLYGEITIQLQNVAALGEQVRRQRSWKAWKDAFAACSQVVSELGALHAQVAQRMARRGLNT